MSHRFPAIIAQRMSVHVLSPEGGKNFSPFIFFGTYQLYESLWAWRAFKEVQKKPFTTSRPFSLLPSSPTYPDSDPASLCLNNNSRVQLAQVEYAFQHPTTTPTPHQHPPTHAHTHAHTAHTCIRQWARKGWVSGNLHEGLLQTPWPSELLILRGGKVN